MKALAILLLLAGAALAQPSTSVRVIDTSTSPVTFVSPGDAANRAVRVNCITGCTSGGGGGTSSTFGAAFPATGTAAGAIDASGNMAGFNLDASGFLKVNGSGVTQPVSGTVAATQSGTWNIATVTALTAITNALPAGTNVIGHVIADSGSTTAVTGNVTVVQPTGTNLHAVLDATSTTAVTQATAGNLNATVVGSGNFTVVQGTGTNLHAVLDSGSTTTVTQATGTNLHVVVDTAPTTAVTQSTSPWIVAGGGTAGSAATGVVTIQGIASMTKLLVTPDANSAINVAQVGGSNVVTSATGVQKVGIVGNANAAIDAATGAAPPANAILHAGLGSGATGGFLFAVPACDTPVNINIATATTTLLITGVSGRHVRICNINMVTAAANNVGIISGTGATCGTGTGAIVGTTAATGYNFAANGGIATGSGFGQIMRTVATGDSVCIITSASTQLSGTAMYAIY